MDQEFDLELSFNFVTALYAKIKMSNGPVGGMQRSGDSHI